MKPEELYAVSLMTGSTDYYWCREHGLQENRIICCQTRIGTIYFNYMGNVVEITALTGYLVHKVKELAD